MRGEFGINANGGGDGNDWFRAQLRLESACRTRLRATGLVTAKASRQSTKTPSRDGNSSFTFDLSKPTGGDASGSVAFMFGGGGSGEWHVLDER